MFAKNIYCMHLTANVLLIIVYLGYLLFWLPQGCMFLLATHGGKGKNTLQKWSQK